MARKERHASLTVPWRQCAGQRLLELSSESSKSHVGWLTRVSHDVGVAGVMENVRSCDEWSEVR